jgi:hypothetical protein
LLTGEHTLYNLDFRVLDSYTNVTHLIPLYFGFP